MTSATSTLRLAVRISADLHTLLKRAAEIQRRTITDLAIAAMRGAQRTITLADAARLNVKEPNLQTSGLLTHARPRAQEAIAIGQ